jgi:hypothetical protein
VHWGHFLKEILPKTEIIALPVGVEITSPKQNPHRLSSKQQQPQPENITIYLSTGKLLVT